MAGTRVSVVQLREALDDWSHGDGALYERLAAALRSAIERGRLPGGIRLPPERSLARGLAVSRSTVASAMDRLESEGFVDRLQGSGTYVRAPRRAPDEGRRELIEELDEHAIIRDLTGKPRATIEFTAAAVPCAPEVVTATRALDEHTLRRWTQGHGYVPLGIPPLREAVAAYLTGSGLPTGTDQIMITVGAAEAIGLTAQVFVAPGDPVAAESPTYVGALDVLRSVGARLLAIDIDHHGVRVDQLADLMARSLPQLVYLTPDFHNPTGVVLDEQRRRRVAELATEFHVPVIEDTVQRELWFDAPAPSEIASHDPAAPVITVGSMSKVFWGGLRIGWLRADPSIIERVGRIKTATNYGTPVVDQLVAARLLPDMDVVAERRRAQLAEGLDTLETALAQHLPDWRWTRPSGGLALWVALPDPVGPDLIAVAERFGVAAVPGPTFGVAPGEHRDRVRLTYVASPDVIRDGVRRLAAAWHELTELGRPTERRALVV